MFCLDELDPTLSHEQARSRPVLVLSEDIFNDKSSMVIADALTSQKPSAGSADVRVVEYRPPEKVLGKNRSDWYAFNTTPRQENRFG